MAGNGPTPKPVGLRQRKNKTSTRASLESKERKRRPVLPKYRDWHPVVKAWWKVVWASPMADEFLDADVPRLHLIADLRDRYERTESNTGRLELAREIRLQEREFGLTPVSRRQLQWEVKKVEGEARKPAKANQEKTGDSRDWLTVMDGGKAK